MQSRVSKAVAVWRRRFQRELRTRIEIAAQMGASAGHGSVAERTSDFRFENTRWSPDQHEMGLDVALDDLGLVVVVGQARITAPAIE